MLITPSLSIGDKVRYTEDGIIGMDHGVVEGIRYNNCSDCLEYLIKWDNGDKSFHTKKNLFPKQNETELENSDGGCIVATILGVLILVLFFILCATGFIK